MCAELKAVLNSPICAALLFSYYYMPDYTKYLRLLLLNQPAAITSRETILGIPTTPLRYIRETLLHWDLMSDMEERMQLQADDANTPNLCMLAAIFFLTKDQSIEAGNENVSFPVDGSCQSYSLIIATLSIALSGIAPYTVTKFKSVVPS